MEMELQRWKIVFVNHRVRYHQEVAECRQLRVPLHPMLWTDLHLYQTTELQERHHPGPIHPSPIFIFVVVSHHNLAPPSPFLPSGEAAAAPDKVL